MKVYKIYPKGFASNSYILTEDGVNAVIVDCAQPRVLEECVKLNLVPQYILLTHGHFDHIGGCNFAYNLGAKICCNKSELEVIYSRLNEERDANLDFKVEKFISDGENFNLCGINFKAIATPGHTKGGMCYIAENCLFSGDTLFFESIGRSDLPTGSTFQLISSIKKLYSLSGDYTVYCGHEEDTTLQHEKEFNPYVRL